tara:strand:- start:2539 stop:2901 length:363 start_codon:yes stop_codon:yes gene_type:complete
MAIFDGTTLQCEAAPSFAANVSETPDIRVTEFGDGYQQRNTMGMNTRRKNWSLQFNARTNADRDKIVGFLQARNGKESFDWIDPTTTNYKKYICESWNVEMVAFNVNNISMEFKQVFESS